MLPAGPVIQFIAEVPVSPVKAKMNERRHYRQRIHPPAQQCLVRTLSPSWSTLLLARRKIRDHRQRSLGAFGQTILTAFCLTPRDLRRTFQDKAYFDRFVAPSERSPRS